MGLSPYHIKVLHLLGARHIDCWRARTGEAESAQWTQAGRLQTYNHETRPQGYPQAGRWLTADNGPVVLTVLTALALMRLGKLQTRVPSPPGAPLTDSPQLLPPTPLRVSAHTNHRPHDSSTGKLRNGRSATIGARAIQSAVTPDLLQATPCSCRIRCAAEAHYYVYAWAACGGGEWKLGYLKSSVTVSCSSKMERCTSFFAR